MIASVVEIPHYRFNTTDYRRMWETGIFQEGDRVQLIAGEIVQMAAMGTKHQACVARLNRFFVEKLGDRAVVWPQNSLEISDNSLPEPDLVLLKPRADFYETLQPRSQDALLVIEVSDSTLRFDREVKTQIYARGGVLEMWLIDINRKAVEVYRDPSENGYQTELTFVLDAEMSPLAFPDCAIAVSQVFA